MARRAYDRDDHYIIMCLFFVCYAYQFAYIPLAWLPARKRQTPKPDHTFAVLIAAHDEATVIGALVSIPLVMREQRTVLGTFRQNWLPFLRASFWSPASRHYDCPRWSMASVSALERRCTRLQAERW